MLRDPGIDERPIRAVADQFHGQLRYSAPRLGQRCQGESLTFHGGQPSDHDHMRVVHAAGRVGRETLVHTGRDDGEVPPVDAQLLDLVR